MNISLPSNVTLLAVGSLGAGGTYTYTFSGSTVAGGRRSNLVCNTVLVLCTTAGVLRQQALPVGSDTLANLDLTMVALGTAGIESITLNGAPALSSPGTGVFTVLELRDTFKP